MIYNVFGGTLNLAQSDPIQGGLGPALRPSINCGPVRNPTITKG